MFDQSGGAASGNKQDAVNGAAGTIFKLLMKSQMGGSGGVSLPFLDRRSMLTVR